MQVFKFDNASYYSPVEWVKENARFIGRVSSFEVYQHECNIPKKYRNVPGIYISEGKREEIHRTYHCILRDDEAEIETWVDGCNCGYGGNGPSATKEVLQILGIKINYDLISRQSEILMKNIVPYYDLNLIVFKPLDRMHNHKEERLKVSFKFQKAHEKWEAKKALSVLGDIHPLQESTLILQAIHFDDLPYSTEREGYDYATNNELVLIKPFAELSKVTLTRILENFAYEYNAQIEITAL